MLDDRVTTEGDLVHDGNIVQWKQQFCDNTGHSMACIDETVQDMAELVSKVCISFEGPDPEELIMQMGVEQFDKHIRAILKNKDCNCKK